MTPVRAIGERRLWSEFGERRPWSGWLAPARRSELTAPRPSGAMLALPGVALTAYTLAACVLAACATGSTAGFPRDRTEEGVRSREPAPAAGGRGAPAGGRDASAGLDPVAGPLGDARAVHGTIDPETGRRTAEPAVDSRLREPRRSEIQSGRLRQAAEEYQPGAGELPYGYRLQVVASPDFGTAGREAARVKGLLEGRLPVYLEFVDPYYKVRVGDFATQEAAQPALGELRALGYPDAWAVRTTIKAGSS